MESQETYSAIDELKREHRVIEKVLDALDRFRMNPVAVPVPVWAKALDFLSRYADGVHHAKEEDVLFPLLRERGLPSQGGPVGCMLHDHETGRELRRAMGLQLPMLGLDPECAVKLSRHAAEYVSLMRFHIHKEDQILFPLGDSLIEGPEQRRLSVKFEAAGERAMKAAELKMYLEIASELQRVADALDGVRTVTAP